MVILVPVTAVLFLLLSVAASPKVEMSAGATKLARFLFPLSFPFPNSEDKICSSNQDDDTLLSSPPLSSFLIHFSSGDRTHNRTQDGIGPSLSLSPSLPPFLILCYLLVALVPPRPPSVMKENAPHK